MKVQYKLIKCYPNSPELGTIAEEKNGSIYFPNTKMTWSCNVKDYFKKTIIDNPEFWEEIKQEEYTILSVKIPGGAILEYDENGNCVKRSDILDPKYTYNLEKILEYGKSYIHSVRRNSDNSIFSIGDMCNPIGQHCKNRHKITKIEFCKVGYLRIGSNNYYLSISSIEHSKKLFTTKDGVDLYKNDEYYTVLTGDTSAISEEVKGPYVADVRVYVSHNIEYFFSKEKAQEFLDSLKPKVLFTAEDGVDIKEGDTIYYIDIDDWSLTERTTRKGDIYKDRGLFPFSNLEKAEKYLLLNKPCLSVKEVFELLDSKVELWKYGRTTSKVIETFKNHVKLKL